MAAATKATALQRPQYCRHVTSQMCLSLYKFLIFTRESSYCFQRVLAVTILSVRLSHGWISQKRSKLELPNLYHWLHGRL